MDPISLSLELKIIKARNINLINSFVRCCISAGSNKRVKLDSQTLISSSSSSNSYDQTFSLDCLGSRDTIECLKQGTIVFELRQRRAASFIGSKLLARAEMPWNDVVGAPNMEIEKWVVMVTKKAGGGGGYDDDDVIKPPAVLVEIKVEEEGMMLRNNSDEWDEHCGCNSCVACQFGAALDAF